MNQQRCPHDIFISYSRKDFEEVSQLIQVLKKQIPDLVYWFDITGIESGDEFEEKIIKAIDNSSFVLFAVSDHSIASPWTRDEVMYAKNINKKVIPVLLKGAELKDWFLFKFGRVDCIDSTNPLQVEKLISNLSSWIAKPAIKQEDKPTLTHPISDPNRRPRWWMWLCAALVIGISVLSLVLLYVPNDQVVQDVQAEKVPSLDVLAQQDSLLQAIEEEKIRLEQERKALAEQQRKPAKQSGVAATPKENSMPAKVEEEPALESTQELIPEVSPKQNILVQQPEPLQQHSEAEEATLTPIEQYTKGLDYFQGKNGVSKNVEEAVRWFSKAAKNGVADAQCDLAYCYFLGVGIAEDTKMAAKWFNEAAQQNHAEAQYMMGMFYEQGIVVEQSERNARLYYHAAAQQGHGEARKKLTSTH